MDDRQLQSTIERASEMAAERAVEKGLNATFRQFGVDLSNVDSVNDLRDDFRYMRRSRTDSEERRAAFMRMAWERVVTTALGAAIPLALYILSGGKFPWHP